MNGVTINITTGGRLTATIVVPSDSEITINVNVAAELKSLPKPMDPITDPNRRVVWQAGGAGGAGGNSYGTWPTVDTIHFSPPPTDLPRISGDDG